MNCSPQQLSEKLTLFTEEYFKLLGNENNSEPEISIAEANLKKWKGLEKEYIQLKETRLLDKPNYILGADGARILIKKDANFYEKIYALILEKFQFTLVTEDNSKKCRVEKMKYELSEMFLDIAEEFLEEGDGGLTSEMAWTAFALEIILFFKEFGILFKGHKSLQTLARYAAEWYYKRFPERFPRTFFRGLMDHINRCLNNYYNGYGTTQEVYNSLIYVQDFCKYFNQIDKKAFKKELDRFLPIDNQPKKFRHIFLKKKSQKMDGDGPDTFIYEASDYREL
ncbi:unnamed protein product [Meloidogyne enterolobii]|uniref:Uncharacterized protein n=1 Tax=Meloidogyne enterolobii TaxID=390850 RepID=A0ACB0Y2V0_MELEN